MLAHRFEREAPFSEVIVSMPDASPRPVPGKAVVARRGLVEIVRAAVLGSYGVTGLAEPTLLWRIRAALRLGTGAIRVNLQPAVQVDVWVTVAFGLPVAEVARQIDSAVRYGLQHALGQAVGPIAIHVEGVVGRPFVSAPPEPPAAPDADGEVEPEVEFAEAEPEAADAAAEAAAAAPAAAALAPEAEDAEDAAALADPVEPAEPVEPPAVRSKPPAGGGA